MTASFPRPALLAFLAALLTQGVVRGDGAPPGKIDFARDVRPILADACHGPDKGKRKADLRLDLRKDAVAAGAIVPGKPDQSELVKRITHAIPSKRMPPVKAVRQLTPAQVTTLRRWVAEGAPYEDHWAF